MKQSKTTVASLGLVIALLAFFGVYIFYASVAVEGVSQSSPENASSSPNSNGLEVTLSISGSRLVYGETINVTVGEYNTLATLNNVSVSHDWANPNLASGPCNGAIYPPVGFAVFRGNYTAQTISSAQPLQIIQPGAVSCPALYYYTKYYVFQSDSKLAQPSFSPYAGSPSPTVPMRFSYPFHGYWSETTAQMMNSTGHNPSLVTFPLGTYTVVAGDEWGDVAILHFTVGL